jgi:hypothetical protein
LPVKFPVAVNFLPTVVKLHVLSVSVSSAVPFDFIVTVSGPNGVLMGAVNVTELSGNVPT